MNSNKIDLIDARTQRNLNSLKHDEGLLRAEFQGVKYFLNLRLGNFIETNVLINGAWEPHIADILASYMRTDEIIIDIGANIGASTIPLAKKYLDSLFYLFEPHPTLYTRMSQNAAMNGLSNLIPVNFAVSDENASIAFYAQKDQPGLRNMGLSSTKPNKDMGDYEEIFVSSVRLDDFFKDIENRVCVIKIDTQGNELEVLKSATSIIDKWRPVVVFEFESEYFSDESARARAADGILSYFNILNYHLYAIQKDSNFLPKVTLNGYFNGDILAVPF